MESIMAAEGKQKGGRVWRAASAYLMVVEDPSEVQRQRKPVVRESGGRPWSWRHFGSECTWK